MSMKILHKKNSMQIRSKVLGSIDRLEKLVGAFLQLLVANAAKGKLSTLAVARK
jgi:hypothetical protein